MKILVYASWCFSYCQHLSSTYFESGSLLSILNVLINLSLPQLYEVDTIIISIL